MNGKFSLSFSTLFLAIFMPNLNLITAKKLSSVSKRSTVECGVPHSSSARIFNGNAVDRLEYPWKAALLKLKDDGDSVYICGGVLVDEETIVTAAHCVRETNEKRLLERDLTIMLGAFNISRKVERGRYFAPVKSINVHDKWNPATLDFEGDIAVIKLTRSVTFDEYIRPVCLANDKISSKVIGSVVAWGVFDDQEKVSDLPRKIDIPIVTDRECFKKSPALLNIIWDDAFCAGKEGAGVCKGDSGSGFYIQENGKFYLRGIVSSSSGRWCSEANFALYSDILKYKVFVGELLKSSTSKVQDNFQNHNVQAECREEGNKILGYTCYIENLDVNVPNFRIGNIATQHQSGKADQDVKSIYVRDSNFKYLPTFDDELLTNKFTNAKILNIDGERSSVPLNFPSAHDKSAIPSDIESFALRKFGDKIKNIPADFLTKSSQLIGFVAHENQITSLPNDLFMNNRKLKIINIYNNKIKTLPANLITNAPHLTELGVGQNEIASIPRDFFHQNPKLEKVYLHNNQITSLPDNLFINNKNLKFIRIYNNKMKTLPANLIANAPFLTEFWANGNEIEKIDSNFFAKSIKMTRVNIDQNRIKQLPANLLSNLEELTHFGATENEIASIPRYFFHQNPKLEKVYLYKNQITSVSDDLFFNNRNLKIISIYANKIKTLPPYLIATAPFLIEFYAYANEIEYIPPYFTENNPKLETLIVFNN